MNVGDLFVTGINGWLSAEVARSSSSEDRNHYLDEYDKVMAGLGLSAENPKNISAQKSLSHINRFTPGNPFWEAFATHPESDAASAKMLFAAMMRLSGTRRMMAYLGASDKEQYQSMRTRSARIPFVTVQKVISNALDNTFEQKPESHLPASPNLDMSDLRELADITIKQGLETIVVVQQSARDGLIVGSNRDTAMNSVAETERGILDFAAHMVIYAAGLRKGEIARVPVLEPRSITDDPGVIYPFRENFWNEYQTV